MRKFLEDLQHVQPGRTLSQLRNPLAKIEFLDHDPACQDVVLAGELGSERRLKDHKQQKAPFSARIVVKKMTHELEDLLLHPPSIVDETRDDHGTGWDRKLGLVGFRRHHLFEFSCRVTLWDCKPGSIIVLLKPLELHAAINFEIKVHP